MLFRQALIIRMRRPLLFRKDVLHPNKDGDERKSEDVDKRVGEALEECWFVLLRCDAWRRDGVDGGRHAG